MKIRDKQAVGTDESESTLDIVLAPGKGTLVILDAIKRHEPYSFNPKLEFERISVYATPR